MNRQVEVVVKSWCFRLVACSPRLAIRAPLGTSGYAAAPFRMAFM